jgi:two-component system cell cycle response regulator
MELMAYLLSSFGHAVLLARDGLEGLEKAREQKPDLIICDIQLPKLDGPQVVRSLKNDANCSAIPVIAVTAMAMAADQARVRKAGFDGYLTKPIDPETFVRHIEAFLSPDFSGFRKRAAGNSADSARQSRRNVHILAVDNVEANLELIRGLFDPLGYDVVTARTPKEALAFANRKIPDLILSDVCMPEMSGYDFIRMVKAVPGLAAVPFVFLTSTMVDDADRTAGLALGAARFLRRPIDAAELLQHVESCLPGGKPLGDNPDRR